jgi:site-specific DNA-methyltransferase (adenine-specific)
MNDQTAQVESAAEWVPLEDVRPWKDNPRKNEGEPVRKVKESIQRFGFGAPILARRANGEIIAGHTRWKAAKELGLERVPVRYLDLDPADAHLLALADNRLSEEAQWDDELLGGILADLRAQGAELALSGFDDKELVKLLAHPMDVEEDEDAVAEPPAEPRSKLGEVYELGSHRLMCGDASLVDHWESLMGGVKADLIWTDPPYGVSYVGGRSRDPRNRKHVENAMTVANDAMTVEQLTAFLRDTLGLASTYVKPGGVWYVAAPPGPPSLAFGQVLTELEVWRQTLVWVKSAFVFGRSDYHYRHEYIFYGWSPGAAHHALESRTQDTIWEFDRNAHSHRTGQVEHPTMKPIGLVERALANSSNPGELVMDCFAGSGTTLIAADKLQRRACLMELDPGYCDVIRDRWAKWEEKLAGSKAA